MKAPTWHGRRDVRVDDAPDPRIEHATDAIVRVTSSDRVVVPFNISCGRRWMCEHWLQSQCETTQVRDEGMGAALFEPLGVEGFATHHVHLTDGPQAYETFQKKADGAFKVVVRP